jgi:hypothetical protein
MEAPVASKARRLKPFLVSLVISFSLFLFIEFFEMRSL